MKLKIIIVIQTILIVFFVAVAIIRTGETEKLFKRAEKQTKLAQENAEKTKNFKALTENAARIAERAASDAVIAENALQKCLKGN